jgi:hypothetical protein
MATAGINKLRKSIFIDTQDDKDLLKWF